MWLRGWTWGMDLHNIGKLVHNVADDSGVVAHYSQDFTATQLVLRGCARRWHEVV